jgi:8-oxo-dGTP diphosphatase
MGKRVSNHGKGTWSLPGGFLEHGETFEECAKREMLEEAGVKIKNVRFYTSVNNIFHDEKKHSITIFMFSDWASGKPRTLEHDKFVDVGWFSVDKLPKPLFLPMKELKKTKPKLFKTSKKPKTDKPRVGVGVFIWKDGKFIMGKRRGSHGHDTWSIPGGHLEFGESIEEGAIREAYEETNLKVGNVRFLALTEDKFPDHGKHYVTIWVNTDWKSGKPKITEPDKWVGQEWRHFKTLPKPLFEPCWKNLKKAKPKLFK